MKIESVSSSQAAALKKANGIAAPGFSLPAGEAAQTSNAKPVANTAPIANLDSLLALQMVDTEQEKKRKATNRAKGLLDQLDTLRVATLTGNVTKSQLINLSNSLKEKLDDFEDEGLKTIIQEIELRAEVELAKLETFLN